MVNNGAVAPGYMYNIEFATKFLGIGALCCVLLSNFLSFPFVFVHRDAWTQGLSLAESKTTAMDNAFTSVFSAMQAGAIEREEAATANATARAAEMAAACTSVWDACQQGVPLRRLRELMELKMESSR